MQRDDVLRKLKSLKPVLEARGVAHAGVFGSVARGEARRSSDIDVVVTPKPGARLGLFDLGAIQTAIEEAFEGKRVDVVVEPVSGAALREAIRRDRADAF
ncbi:MAG: nucleotidyltransferase domain-containing protein [Parvularculaceae bacterium]|nr:nucleotidyltransferase domain-containing protein [Parvularculaceae bacterium]